MTFDNTKKLVKRVQYEHLLAEDDSERGDVGAAEDFVELDVQEDAGVSFVGKRALIRQQRLVD